VLHDITLCDPARRLHRAHGAVGIGQVDAAEPHRRASTSPTRASCWSAARTSPLSEAELADWRAANVGFIFQFYNLMPVLNAFENVELPLLLTSMSRRERRERVETALSLVGLADRMEHNPNELSGGQQQRVAIARAFITDPTLIVADEPTGDLDRKSAEEILGLMRRLNAEMGKTIIMVSHDAHAVQSARHVTHLEKGELIAA
jgi:putative ABC transport system ATP-binding protein